MPEVPWTCTFLSSVPTQKPTGVGLGKGLYTPGVTLLHTTGSMHQNWAEEYPLTHRMNPPSRWVA